MQFGVEDPEATAGLFGLSQSPLGGSASAMKNEADAAVGSSVLAHLEKVWRGHGIGP